MPGMGFFDHLQPKGSNALKVQKPQIRREVPKTDNKKHSSSNKPKNKLEPPRRDTSSSATGTPAPPSRVYAHGPRKLTKSRSTKRLQRKQQTVLVLESSSEDEDESSGQDHKRKRVKVQNTENSGPRRQLVALTAFADRQSAPLDYTHGVAITNQEAIKYIPAFPNSSETPELELQYPSRVARERYRLLEPKQTDDFKPLEDIILAVETTLENYYPEREHQKYGDEIDGFVRRLRRAVKMGSEDSFRDAVAEYNNVTQRLVYDGTIEKQLRARQSLSLSLIERILTQVYERVVSPMAKSLTKYENGTDNVYGELLSRFSSQIFKESNLKADQIFVDLGSGVGNVVLQAALEVGCESWGCEIMTNATKLAERQKEEFKSRCQLWGLAPGAVNLHEGDFLKSEAIRKILPQADVVLVNNQAFTPDLNDRLVHLFLDLKDGCRIVSLKSFIPPGHKITERNKNAVVNTLTEHRELNYWSGSVSWTNAGGTYHVVTKQALGDN